MSDEDKVLACASHIILGNEYLKYKQFIKKCQKKKVVDDTIKQSIAYLNMGIPRLVYSSTTQIFVNMFENDQDTLTSDE
jgi:ribosome-associated toxin RatA of RatAB toxin-antitoxin module